jgi:hypothetical protein
MIIDLIQATRHQQVLWIDEINILQRGTIIELMTLATQPIITTGELTTIQVKHEL